MDKYNHLLGFIVSQIVLCEYNWLYLLMVSLNRILEPNLVCVFGGKLFLLFLFTNCLKKMLIIKKYARIICMPLSYCKTERVFCFNSGNCIVANRVHLFSRSNCNSKDSICYGSIEILLWFSLVCVDRLFAMILWWYLGSYTFKYTLDILSSNA